MSQPAAPSGLPKVLVVGDPRLGDMLASSGAQWHVQPVSPTVNAMWDAVEAGTLDAEAPIAVFSDGTGSGVDDLESTIAAFAPFAVTFVVAAPDRAQAIIARAITLASTVPNGNPAAPIFAMPVHDTRAALDFMRTALQGRVVWGDGVAPQQPDAPTSPAAQPAPAPTATAAQPAREQMPMPGTPVAAQASEPTAYEQAHVYAPHVVATAANSIPKPANARPGQLTIASMSSKGGSGKCLRGDTIIVDPRTGMPFTIASVVENQNLCDVAAFDGARITVHPIGERFDSGAQPTCTLTLASGRTLVATDTHPLYTRSGWTPLADLQPGDLIALPGSVPFPTEPVHLDTDELDVLAIATARATIGGHASLDDLDGAIATILDAAASSLHAAGTVSTVTGANPMALRNPRQHRMRAACSAIASRHGLTDHHPVIPVAAYRLDDRQLARFMSLYWMTGGRVSVTGDATITVLSQQAADALQHLLLRFSIQTSQDRKGGIDASEPTWNVTVHPDSLGRFAETIPMWGHKETNLTAAVREAGTSDIFWDTVVSAEPADLAAQVYDIEVPGPHSFVANDIIVHNSTTAALLAGTIAKSSAAAGKPLRVVLVDLDTRDGQVASLIGKYMPTSINIRVMPEWNQQTVLANLVHDDRLGIDALLAPVRPRNADDVGPDFYRHIIGVLQTTHDVVILDCSVNYLDPLLGTAFAMSDEILFVTTLATTSVQGMARSLTELFADPADGGLGIPKEKVGIVANQVIRNVGMGKDKLLRAALGAPLVGQIPSDQDAVLIATNSNRMFDLLKHPSLGPAFFRLAVNCMPNVQLTPITAEQVVAAQQQADTVEQRRGLFRRS